MRTRTDMYLALICCSIFIGSIITGIVLISQMRNTSFDLDFCDEDIIVTFNGTIATIFARYGLHNRGERQSISISLPFASKPWNISLTFGEESLSYYWSEVSVDQQEFSAIIFQITLEKNQKEDILVHYQRGFEILERNGTKYGHFKYIVGSTRSWGEPLDFAHFEFWCWRNQEKELLETRTYTNWLPMETFVIFEFVLC